MEIVVEKHEVSFLTEDTPARFFDPTPDKHYTEWIEKTLSEIFSPEPITFMEEYQFSELLTVWMFLEATEQVNNIEEYSYDEMVSIVTNRLSTINTNGKKLSDIMDERYKKYLKTFGNDIPEKYDSFVYNSGLWLDASFEEIEYLIKEWEKHFPEDTLHYRDINEYNLDDVRYMIEYRNPKKLDESKETPEEQVIRLGEELELELEDTAISELVMGMVVEKEHGSQSGDIADITHDDEMMTFKIALAHVMEIPDYYTRLTAMEAEAGEMESDETPEPIEESLATARRDYKDLADKYKDLDPTPTYKYLDWICKVISEDENVIEDISFIINSWHSMLLKNQIPKDSRDINQLSFDDVVEIIGDFDETETKTQIKKQEKIKVREDSTIVFENDDWTVVVPHTEEASNHYGQGTKWCISATESENSFLQYTNEHHAHFYFVLSKKSNEKYAFAMYENTILEVRNSINKYLFFSGMQDVLEKAEQQYSHTGYEVEDDPRLKEHDEPQTKVFWMGDNFFSSFKSMLEGESHKRFTDKADYYDTQPEELILNIPMNTFSVLPDEIKNKIWESKHRIKEAKEDEPWADGVNTNWTPPEGLFNKSANDIANTLKDNSKDVKQAVALLMYHQNKIGKDMSTKDLGKLNRAQALLRTAFESKQPFGEKIVSKFSSGEYYFSLKSKEEKEMRELEKKLRRAKDISIQSIHPPTKVIIVKVNSKTHKLARSIVRLVVDKMNVVVEGRRRVSL